MLKYFAGEAKQCVLIADSGFVFRFIVYCLIVVLLCRSNYPRVVVEKFRASAAVGSIKIEQTNFVVRLFALCFDCQRVAHIRCAGVRCVSPRGQAAVALPHFRGACGRRPQRRYVLRSSVVLCAHFPFSFIFSCCWVAGAKAVIAEVRKKHGDKVVFGGFPRLITEVCCCLPCFA